MEDNRPDNERSRFFLVRECCQLAMHGLHGPCGFCARGLIWLANSRRDLDRSGDDIRLTCQPESDG